MFEKLIKKVLKRCFFCEDWVILGGGFGEYKVCINCMFKN